jgi:hypothetical protein
MSVIAASVDLRPLFGPARNQGPRPTCLAFAASDAHAALRPGWVPLSCEYAFYQAQRRAARPPSTGALPSATLAALREDGQPEENGWPYLAATPTDAASWSPPAKVGPLFGRDGEKSSPAIDQVIAELDQCRPVIILTMLSRSFYMPISAVKSGHVAAMWRRAPNGCGSGLKTDRRPHADAAGRCSRERPARRSG